jgi:SAM-dependent methyltransferase/uncharacterized protein YbaR (Trm112 family)
VEQQDLRNQKGEIEFRRLLVRQQVAGDQIFDDELGKDEMIRVLEQRIRDTAGRMRELKSRGVTLAPYLEIGAERGQRSLVMENDLGAHGAAADISFDMLSSATHWARVFERPRMPLRLCCDIYNLPLRTDSLPFVFCYETLHHFPDPGPILAEVRRVMAPGGVFYVDEEPVRRTLRQHWVRAPKTPGPNANVVQRGFHRVIRFFSEPAYNEIEYGIIENHSISIAEWRRQFSIFEEVDMMLSTLGDRARASLRGATNPLGWTLNYLVGGKVGGICRKTTGAGRAAATIEEALACPQCRTRGAEPPLRPSGDAYVCGACGASYPVRDGVVFLLVAEKRAELYPELATAS